MIEHDNINIIDDDHLYINGRQFISLRRLLELENNKRDEIKILDEKVANLTKENESYKILLKDKLLKEE